MVKVSGINMVEPVEQEIRSMGYSTDSMESIRKPMEKEARQKQMMLGRPGRHLPVRGPPWASPTP